MTSFLGLEVEQDKGQIRLHLDTYVNEMLEYKANIKRDLKPKKIPMQPGVVLTKDDAPETPDPKEQKIYRSFVAKIQFVANWVRYDISFAAFTIGPFLCISRRIALGRIASFDGISEQQSKFQTRLSAWEL